MADTTISPNMNLPVPVVGVDSGPDYANNINNCFSLIDQHNHTAGNGVQVPSSGININSDLLFNVNNATLLRTVRFSPQSAVLSLGTDIGCLYEVGVDLYYNDGSGNQVRITQSGGIAGSPGSIANLTSPATASYVSANQTFVWQSDASTPANMDFAAVIFRNLTANSKGLTLNPPNSMATNYSLTLPLKPLSTLPMILDSTGAMGTAQIVTAQIADQAVTANKIADQAVTANKILTDIDFNGRNVQMSGQTILVTPNPAVNYGLILIRGVIQSNGAITTGEGFTVVHTSTGIYTITFTNAFADLPSVVVTSNQVSGITATVIPSTGSCQISLVNVSIPALFDSGFNFIAVGQRST